MKYEVEFFEKVNNRSTHSVQLEEHFPEGGKGANQYKKVENSTDTSLANDLTDTTLADAGITFDESSDARLVYDEPELVEESIEEIKLIENKAAAEFGK
jgi:hypothetical protein